MTSRQRCGVVSLLTAAALFALNAEVSAQQPDHPQVKAARADILRLVPDATDIRLTRPGCTQDPNVRCMVCVEATIKGQKRIGAVMVRQAEVEDNTFDPRQPPMTRDAEAGLRAVCGWR